MSEPRTYGGQTLAYWRGRLDLHWYPTVAAMRDMFAAVEDCEKLRADNERLLRIIHNQRSARRALEETK